MWRKTLERKSSDCRAQMRDPLPGCGCFSFGLSKRWLQLCIKSSHLFLFKFNIDQKKCLSAFPKMRWSVRTASGKGFLTSYSSVRAGCFVSSFFLAKTYRWNLFKFSVFLSLLPAGFSVSGISPRQITFNFPASTTDVLYEVFRVTSDGGQTFVAQQDSSTNPTQQMFSVEPGTLYRFQMTVFDPSTGQRSSFSSPVDVIVPPGKCQKTQFSSA